MLEAPPPQLFVAIAEGACLGALLGVALFLIIETAGVFNFAVGGFAVLAPFMMMRLLEGGFPLVAAVILAIVPVAAACVVSDLVIGRPIERRSQPGDELPTVLAFAALLFAISQGVGWIFGRQVITVRPLVGGAPLRLGSVFIPRQSIVMVAVAVVLFAAIWAWMRWGRSGRLLRAIGDNLEAARLIGVPMARIRALGFALGGALAALAGILHSSKGGVSFDSALHWSLIGFLALVVGGRASVWAPFVGAFVISTIEALVAFYWGGEYVNFAILALALVFFSLRPAGIFAVRVRT